MKEERHIWVFSLIGTSMRPSLVHLSRTSLSSSIWSPSRKVSTRTHSNKILYSHDRLLCLLDTSNSYLFRIIRNLLAKCLKVHSFFWVSIKLIILYNLNAKIVPFSLSITRYYDKMHNWYALISYQQTRMNVISYRKNEQNEIRFCHQNSLLSFLGEILCVNASIRAFLFQPD